MLCLLAAPLSHAPSLTDQICEYAKVGKDNHRDYPDRLGPAGDIVASKEVAKDRDEQPEPDKEDEYREDVCQKIAESEAFCEEEHRDSPYLLDGLFAGVANSLLLFCCLRRSSNHCSGNSKVSPPVRQRTHAFTGCIFSRETRGKLSRTPHGESAAGGFDMCRPRL